LPRDIGCLNFLQKHLTQTQFIRDCFPVFQTYLYVRLAVSCFANSLIYLSSHIRWSEPAAVACRLISYICDDGSPFSCKCDIVGLRHWTFTNVDVSTEAFSVIEVHNKSCGQPQAEHRVALSIIHSATMFTVYGPKRNRLSSVYPKTGSRRYGSFDDNSIFSSWTVY
jgi:hypothetical protein